MTGNNSEQCCPEFDPVSWQGREVNWQDKSFIRETIPQFMHIPLPGTFGKAVSRMWQKLENAGARPEDKDFLMLTSETSPWKGEIYINSVHDVPEAENVKLSGTFITRVFDGPYNAVPKWIKEMEDFLTGKNKTASNYYFYYTTCPKCAKKYGHNYVVVFARVS